MLEYHINDLQLVSDVSGLAQKTHFALEIHHVYAFGPWAVFFQVCYALREGF